MRTLYKKLLIGLFAVLLGASLLAAGCSSDPGADSKKKVVKLAYVNWAEGVAMTHLAKAVMEEHMGYGVELTMVDVAPLFTALANGDCDAFLDSWLPLTHQYYMKEYGDQLVDLGPTYQGAKIGLVVPEYVSINSIEELNSVKDKFDRRIIGIDSGASTMQIAEQMIKEYQLDYDLVQGSEPAMLASLQDAIEKQQWIVITGWKPHWKFSSWKLKFLDDPRQMFGVNENIHVLARKNITEDLPDVAQFLTNFKLDDEQLGSLMGMIAESNNPEKSAREWMNNNQTVVNSWLAK